MLHVENVSHSYDTTPVLNDINLTVNQGEIVCLLGESGSGKTTLLRVIAGLEAGYSGTVKVAGQAMAAIPIHKRGFGLMFQDFALFPHMTVARNVAYGLRMQNVPKNEQDKTVQDMLALVGLEGYHDRDVNALSGGQKQRVALARSLAPRPRLLMLDEPLGSLDAGLRERLVVELRRIINQIGLTAIYVTHDQQEAFAIADRIAIMNQGRIAQYATPETLYQQPESVFVAQFLGLTNIVSAKFIETYCQITIEGTNVLIHPESLTPDTNGSLAAIVTERVFQGEAYRLQVRVDDVTLMLTVPAHGRVPHVDETIQLAINPEFLQVFTNS